MIDGTCVRPFLTQSDPASRQRPLSTGLFFDWILPFLLIVSRVDFIISVLFLEAVDVRQYCCMEIENLLAALCFARSARATCARARRTLVLVALSFQSRAAKATFVELHSAESRQSYSRRSRCSQNGIDTARCCRRVIHAAGERS